MSTTLPSSAAREAVRPAWRPSVLRLGLGRILLEIKLFNRDVLSLVLVLFFPILMMSLFGTVFGDEPVFGAGAARAGATVNRSAQNTKGRMRNGSAGRDGHSCNAGPRPTLASLPHTAAPE